MDKNKINKKRTKPKGSAGMSEADEEDGQKEAG
jgi:hypothetical protein